MRAMEGAKEKDQQTNTYKGMLSVFVFGGHDRSYLSEVYKWLKFLQLIPIQMCAMDFQ